MAAWIAVMVSGAGIVTQPAFQATKGLHGSMYFTLSLPVSRLRLFAVRASLGWLEMMGGIALICGGIWALLQRFGESRTPLEMGEYSVVLIVFATAIYAIPVLLSTFLDDQWRVFGSAFCIGGLLWLSERSFVPTSLNIFRALGPDSPLLTHVMPWTAVAGAIALAAILLFAAVKIVQGREY
jgi:hypothetical protein